MRTIHRRTLLAALAVTGATGVAAGCTERGGSSSRPGGQSTPDPQLVDLADERELLAAYDATIARHAALADRLAPLRDHHAQHVAALERVMGRTPDQSATARPSGGPEQTKAADAGTSVPPTPAAALAALRAMERSAATARAGSCTTAPVDRAPLLGSIAACEASHEVLLT
jgi:hypothetical protein